MATFLRNINRLREPVWHVQLAMLAAIILQFLLPGHFFFASRELILGLEVLLLAALSFTTPREKIFRSLTRRINVLLLIGLAGVANSYALTMVANKLLSNGHISNGRELILTALNIYLTNIIIFALFYWEMDGGGPGERLKTAKYDRDFMFPQNQNEDYKHPEWRPTFVDYIYVSSTNAMAFSPTDTLPISRRAKMLMLAQSAISLVAIALVAARAVNILG